MKRYATMVFDVGGTLLRFDLDKLTRAYIERAAALGYPIDLARARAVLEKLEMELPARSRERQISLELENGRGFWNEFYAEGFHRLGIEQDMSAPASDIREHFQRGEFETLFSDVLPALDALKGLGIQLGILSNFSENCEDVLRLVHVHRYFSFFVVSARVGVEKPDPRIFRFALDALRCSPDKALVVGDSYDRDIVPAKSLGCGTVWLHDGFQEPGLDSGKADLIIPSLSGLNSILSERIAHEDRT